MKINREQQIISVIISLGHCHRGSIIVYSKDLRILQSIKELFGGNYYHAHLKKGGDYKWVLNDKRKQLRIYKTILKYYGHFYDNLFRCLNYGTTTDN